jgi:hypothetical protein
MRSANAIDFWRGFALITIFINHVPGIVWERLTHRNISLSDSAELFVFLAGWSLRFVVGRPEDPPPAWRLVLRLWGRAFVIYAAHILIISLAIAMLAAAALVAGNPLLLEWHNAAAVFQAPVEAHIGLVLLSHHLGYFDILPLYVVLMFAAPGLALIDRYWPRAVLPLSIAVYLAALATNTTVKTWPVDGQWFFNPFAWQLVFVLGFSFSRRDGAGKWVQDHIRWLRLLAWPLLILAAASIHLEWSPDPTRMPEPTLLFIIQKEFVTPIRLIQFLALLVAASAFYPTIARFAAPLTSIFSMLGRNSLEVFCVGSVASLAAQIVRYVFGGGYAIDTLVLIAGVSLLVATAWVKEWRESMRSR